MTGSRFGATYDVIVVGGGNAGLVAAISARHIVDSVLLLERAPSGGAAATVDIRGTFATRTRRASRTPMARHTAPTN